jgi:2-polyprenyl-6-methoxyphenol hydroxylase-like FAD-dependent oxidoreductase
MDYDLIAIGGGLAGASLARAMAEEGAKVLVLEREDRFKDRVRGEFLLPWGVAESQALGLHDLLIGRCGHDISWLVTYFEGSVVDRRHLPSTNPNETGSLSFSHPTMQEALLQAAAAAGATVYRAAKVTHLEPGSPPHISVRHHEHDERLQARLIVGADGRNGSTRQWAGFHVHRDPERLIVAGVELQGLAISGEASHFFLNPPLSQGAFACQTGEERFRCYFFYHHGRRARPLSGRRSVGELISACIETGVPAEWYENAEDVGPLASFEGAECWVDHPYSTGIALVGDAAARTDPTWGCGLSLTLRDVRVLRDCLIANGDWNAAGHTYAEMHDRYFHCLHRVTDWYTTLYYDRGPAADAQRARALPLLREDASRNPDFIGSGPDAPCDETARRRFFGEV